MLARITQDKIRSRMEKVMQGRIHSQWMAKAATAGIALGTGMACWDMARGSYFGAAMDLAIIAFGAVAAHMEHDSATKLEQADAAFPLHQERTPQGGTRFIHTGDGVPPLLVAELIQDKHPLRVHVEAMTQARARDATALDRVLARTAIETNIDTRPAAKSAPRASVTRTA